MALHAFSVLVQMDIQVCYDGPEWEAVSDEAKDFLAKLLDRDCNTRMTAAEGLQHPWIAKFCGGDVCLAAETDVQLPPATPQGSLR